MSTNALRKTPGLTIPDLLIVARDHAGLCQALREMSATRKGFTVIVERRQAERRQRIQPVLLEQRSGERRLAPATAKGQRRPYVQVRRP